MTWLADALVDQACFTHDFTLGKSPGQTLSYLNLRARILAHVTLPLLFLTFFLRGRVVQKTLGSSAIFTLRII